jgi:ATP-dependent Clp protease ATP-binding subunit ClpA
LEDLMFERFSVEARDAVVRALRIAGELKHPQVGSEHMLLSVLKDESGIGGQVLRDAGVDADRVRAEVERLDGLAGGLLTEADANALRSVGIDLDAVLARIEETFGPDALQPNPGGRFNRRGRSRSVRSRFGPDAKKSLQLALRESIRLHNRQISSGHLLLGLIRDGDGKASRILTAIGLRPAELRAATEAALRRTA